MDTLPLRNDKGNDAADANAHMGYEASDESKQQYDAWTHYN